VGCVVGATSSGMSATRMTNRFFEGAASIVRLKISVSAC
jgi:hypothetical protein